MTSATEIETDILTDVDERDRPVINVYLQNPADRELIDQYLSDRFEILFSERDLDEGAFDLCITDRETLENYKEDVASYKDSKAPLFTPFILLEKNPSWSRQSDPLVNLVDDVVPIPVSPGVLISRIEIQLKTRVYSLKLQHKNEKLQEEKEKYRLITENATDMVIINRPDGTFTYVSPASKQLTGYTPDELVGRSYYEFSHPNDLERLEHTREKIMNNPGVHTLIYRFKTKGGKYKWVETGVRSIRDPESGEVVEIQGAVRDISDRKEYEQKLEEEKERYRLITENSNDMITLHAPDATYRYVSPSSERLIGYKPEELVGKSPFENMHPEDRETYFEEEPELFADGDEFSMTFRKKTKQDDYIWVETRMRPIRDEETGEVLEIQASTRDISERKEYEQKLEAEKEFNDTVISSMPSLFYVIDEDLNLIRWNNKMEEMLGYSGEELASMSPLDVYKKDDHPMVRKKIQEVLETGEAEMEAEIIPKQGPVQRHFINGKTFTKNGKTYITGTGIDLTNQYKTLHDLKERIKEQTCLYNIAKLNGQPETVEELLDAAVTYLPDGWQYPEITEAAIEFDGKQFTTEGYRENRWVLVNERKVIQGKSLTVKVVYLEEKPILDEGPFLKEERKLIDAIADTLASQIQRILSQKNLKQSEKRWEQLVQKNPSLVQIMSGHTIQFINPAGARLYGMHDPEELIGKSWSEFITFEDEELVNDRVRRTLNGENLPPKAHKVYTWDGRERFIEVQSVPVHYRNESALLTVGQDVTERIEYEQKLQQSLEEKQVLLQEVHHRVKNNLAVITGLLELQAMEVQDPELKEILTSSQLRIHSIAKVHELIYRQENLNKIDFSSYIRDLTEKLSGMYNHQQLAIEFDLDLTSSMLNIHQAIPCGMILNELLTNAIKHAFKDRDSGKIFIRLDEEKETLHLSIWDDGSGLPESVDFMQQNSFGSTIIDLLSRQLKAEFNYSSDDGTRFDLSFTKEGYTGPLK